MILRPVLETRVVTGSGGGPDKTILNTPRFLVGTAYPTVCAYLRPPGDPGFAELERRAAGWQAPLEAIDDRGAFDRQVAGKLLECCRRHGTAIWHGHDYKTNVLGVWAARRRPLKLVTTVHGWVKRTWKTPLYYALDKWSLKRHDAVICVSDDLFEECHRLGVPKAKLHLVRNGIDTEEFRRRAPRTQDGGRLVVGALGRLSAEKGFDLLLRAAKICVDRGIDLEVRIGGDGDQQARLQALIGELGLGDRARLLGFVADTPAFFEGLDAFALSSHREGLPNVVLEAMAFALPVVSTKVAGVPKLIADGSNGLLVDCGSAEQLADRLATIAADSALRQRLGAAARATIEADYSFARRMDAIVGIYDRLWEDAR